jgi:protein-S-isoprenylcysteine O-methyltransferase Ste14
MNFLETKIPPPIVTAIFGLLIWLCRDFGAAIDFGRPLRIASLIGFVVIALAIDISAFLEFRKFKTTINPLAPQNASNIVQSGVFSKTRNPMYLGMVLLLSGWAIWNTSLIGLFLVGGFALYIHFFQIKPEERALSAKFGQEYLDYLQKVRRWI